MSKPPILKSNKMRAFRSIVLVLVLSVAPSQQTLAETLPEAVRDGNVERVERWLAQGGDVNARHNFGPSPFDWGSTLLHAAVSLSIRHQIQANDTLALFGVSLEAAPSSAYTPVLSGSDKRYQPLASQLQRQLAMVSLLLTRGADVNLATSFGGQRTPLHIAVGRGSIDVVELLLAHGADVNARLRSSYFPTGASDLGNWEFSCAWQGQMSLYLKGRTPLHLALCRLHTPIAELLLAHGADVNAQDSLGYTPLHIASLFPGPETATLLLERGAHMDSQDENGKTPFQIAVEHGNLKTAEVLAVEFGRTAMAEMLRQRGAKE